MKTTTTDRAAGLSPHLIVNDAARAIEFYCTTFGATEVFRLCEPGSKRIGHAELDLGGSLLMLADEYPDFGCLSPVTVGGTPVILHLYVEDVDQTFARAVEAGATALSAPKDEFFGDRTGTLCDPFGHRWQLSTRKEVVTPKEMQRRWDAASG